MRSGSIRDTDRDELTELLAAAKLLKHAAAIEKAGYAEPDDLRAAEDEELLEVGIRKPEIKRLRKYLSHTKSSTQGINVMVRGGAGAGAGDGAAGADAGDAAAAAAEKAAAEKDAAEKDAAEKTAAPSCRADPDYPIYPRLWLRGPNALLLAAVADFLPERARCHLT